MGAMGDEMLTFVMFTTDLSGAGGMTRPFCRYLSDSLSWSPRKSENRRVTVDSEISEVISINDQYCIV